MNRETLKPLDIDGELRLMSSDWGLRFKWSLKSSQLPHHAATMKGLRP